MQIHGKGLKVATIAMPTFVQCVTSIFKIGFLYFNRHENADLILTLDKFVKSGKLSIYKESLKEIINSDYYYHH